MNQKLNDLSELLRKFIPVAVSVVNLIDESSPIGPEDLPMPGECEVPVSGKMFTKLREDLNLTQAYIATCLGVTTNTVSRYERGVTSSPIMNVYAGLLQRLSVRYDSTQTLDILKSLVAHRNEHDRLEYLYRLTSRRAA